MPGGSSGGSAACVAARMAPLAVGTDTGGSIRCPAGLCGITGLKPTYGRVSRYGLVAFASSLDQIGPLGQTAEDAALLLEVLAGHDPLDSTSIDLPVPQYSETVRQPLEGLRLGLVREHFGEGLDAEVEAAVREAVRVYESLGATVKRAFAAAQQVRRGHVLHHRPVRGLEQPGPLRRRPLRLSHRREGDGRRAGGRAQDAASRPATKRPWPTSTTPLIRMYRRSRAEGFGAEVKRRIMLGTYALSAGYYDAYYKKALKVRRLIRQDFDRAFEEVDLIVGPVTPTPAFKIGERVDDPLAMYLFDLYTVSTNLAGIGGISIPCGFSSAGLPIGLHLQAPPFEEERLLRGAAHVPAGDRLAHAEAGTGLMRRATPACGEFLWQTMGAMPTLRGHVRRPHGHVSGLARPWQRCKRFCRRNWAMASSRMAVRRVRPVPDPIRKCSSIIGGTMLEKSRVGAELGEARRRQKILQQILAHEDLLRRQGSVRATAADPPRLELRAVLPPLVLLP